jgi:hypothetical protein
LYEQLAAKHKVKGPGADKKEDGGLNKNDFSTGFDHGFSKFDTNL